VADRHLGDVRTANAVVGLLGGVATPFAGCALGAVTGYPALRE
jgi:hypothetical protein